MSSHKIEEIIPTQNFEIIRDIIGAILTVELENQKTLQGFSYPINVYSGRSTPFQDSEKVMVNVSCDSGNYNTITEFSARGPIMFTVDVYVSSKQTDTDDGGKVSSIIRDKFIGMIRYILSSHFHRTLGLTDGNVLGTYVRGFDNYEPQNNSDSSFVKMSRLNFEVDIYEDQKVYAGVQISSIFTDIKLELTNKGYKYIREF